MTPRETADDGAGGRTAAEGTPVPVDVSPDRRARVVLAVFLAGPVTAITHFMLVYLVVEAGCTGDGPGLRLFHPPVPDAVTLAATAVAALVCLGLARWGFVRWRAHKHERTDRAGELSKESEAADPGGSLAFAGLLLSLLSFVTVLLVGLPAIVLPAC